LFWYVHAAVRGRFATSAETALAKDLETADREGVDGLISALRRTRKGRLTIDAQDYEGAGRGSRSYPLLYLTTRVGGARDLVSGHVLGNDSGAVEVHEIFPRSLLTKHGYSRNEVNSVANFAFVSPTSAMRLGHREPEEYLTTFDPAVRASQWIPDDPKLWRLDQYRQFLAARRKLLAAAANEFLERLLAGTVPHATALQPISVTEEVTDTDARAAQVAALVAELTELGYATPALDVEVPDPETGVPLAVAEAFWPDGLQIGQGKPIVLELDPEEADIPRLTELGCEVFTSVDALRGYVQRLGEVASGQRDSIIGVSMPEPEPPAVDDAVLDAAPDEAGGAFDRAVLDLIERSRSELRYNPRYFRVMVTQYGALGAARRLLHAPAVSDGFVTLWERGRLDLSVESLALDPRFAHLFTSEELSIARKRLDDFGYGPTAA
jgi:hypothetical protein